MISVAAVLLALGIAGFMFSDYILAGMVAALKGRPWAAFSQRPFFTRVKDGLAQTARDTRRLLGALPYGPATLLLSLVNHATLGLVVLYLAHAMSLSLSPAAALFLFPLVLLLSTIPISLAGWGIREAAMVLVFSPAGLQADASLGVSVLFGACSFLSGLPGGVIWLFARREMNPAGDRTA